MFCCFYLLRPHVDQDYEHRYEAILLAPGENKIDVEVDTRKSCCLKQILYIY